MPGSEDGEQLCFEPLRCGLGDQGLLGVGNQGARGVKESWRSRLSPIPQCCQAHLSGCLGREIITY